MTNLSKKLQREFDAMTAAQKNLLLFLETQAVDYGGAVDVRRLEHRDHVLIRAWSSRKFITYGRIATDSNLPTYRNVWVTLSPEAWAMAHAERQARNARMNAKRAWRTTEELGAAA